MKIKDLERVAKAIRMGKVYHLFFTHHGVDYISSFFTVSCARTYADSIGAKVVYLSNQ